MPFVTGETLRSRLERAKQLPLDEALRIAREVADALGIAHALAIIHRDIKPENILLQGGHALVADFGNALAAQQAARSLGLGLSPGTRTGRCLTGARSNMTRIPWCGCLLLGMLGGCRTTQAHPPAAVLAAARQELEQRGRTDQAVREGFGAGGLIDSAQARAMMQIDSANTSWLKAHVLRWGWPTAAQVGRPAVETAFLIVQHAVQDTGFMRAMLPAIEEAYRRGELKGEAVALLTDRLEVKAGRTQVYGTQLSLRNGRWIFDPIMDSAHVDARRATMGLPPLIQYMRLIDSVFRAH